MTAISDGDWESLAKKLLRAELMRRGLSYARLVDALAAIGVDETEASIKNKMSRGRFTSVFFCNAWSQSEPSGSRCPLQPRFGGVMA